MEKENRRLTSVSIHVNTLKKIRRFADPINLSAAKFVELLMREYEKNPIPLISSEEDIIYPRAIEWKWPGPYAAIVADERVQDYKSTEWIRTKEYMSECGTPFTTIDQRIRDKKDPLRVSKICVVSQKAWGEGSVWNWIGGWLQYRLWGFANKFSIYVIREKVAKLTLRNYEDHRKYFDMGIYDKFGAGFLNVGPESKPEGYTQRWLDSERKVADNAFKELQKAADEIKNLNDLNRLQSKQY